ncbi:MAG TPA: glycosyltransferase family 4 protein, partial [Phenylobacterium sp.]
MTGPRLMGRQSAGNGFLRAAVQARGAGPVTGYTGQQSSAEAFRRTVSEIDPAAETRWIPGPRLDLLAQNGLLYRPDPWLGPAARHRLQLGPAAYSLCGVIHGLAGEQTLERIGMALVDPAMPWDAIVCTSAAALSVVSGVIERQAEYLRWRTGQAEPVTAPLLPVMPLGVHCADFAFTDDARRAARLELGLDAADVAVLVAGRQSVGDKAHPYATLVALQRAAEGAGKPIVLVLAGKPPSPQGGEAFRAAVAAHCPGVRAVFVDGHDFAAYNRAWAAADLFLSLADSIQETFGLTPVEAMASGLPALVSDWSGYRDTVRDGVDGFRIATWAPAPTGADTIAIDYETGADSLGRYMLRSATAVAVDMGQLADRLAQLVTDETLRRRMGSAGQARARATFDWSVVFQSYQALWDEQTAMRRKASEDPATAAWLSRAPKAWPDQVSPFELFASYPTHQADAATWVTRAPGMTPQVYRDLMAHAVLPMMPVAQVIVDRVLQALEAGPATVEQLARLTDVAADRMAEVAARLAKIDVVILSEQP